MSYHILRMGWTSIIACLACLCSCTSEESDALYTPAEKQVEVTLHFSTRADQASELEAPESKIETLHIYAFNSQHKLVGHHYAQLTEAPSGTTSVKITLPGGMLTFYAIANEEAAGPLKLENLKDFTLPRPENNTLNELEKIALTPENLNQVTFSKLPEAELRSGNPDEKDEKKKSYRGAILPMTGIKTQQVSTSGSITMDLTRSVAKLNLYFSKVGVISDEVYLGRGLYLYNEPQYGYLFPNTYSGNFSHLEQDSGGDNSDSQLNQKNGKVILRSGWPEEPKELTQEHAEQVKQTHINEITKYNNTPGHDENLQFFEQIPAKPIYLFANPNQVPTGVGNMPGRPGENDSKGYYLKITTHIHTSNEQGPEVIPPRKVFYVSLPVVQANDQIEVYSKIVVDGFISIKPHWKITPWKTGGANIDFN